MSHDQDIKRTKEQNESTGWIKEKGNKNVRKSKRILQRA